ncbi:MAG: DNA alkylation repair protein [Marinovum sp.]|nr:DNA alkylation repair protein [Marinovum sp.]
MKIDEALAALSANGDAKKAAEMAAYHKVDRRYLGVANPALDEMTRAWRRSMTLDERLRLAAALWFEDCHETRIAAAKLLTQARIRPDGEVWHMILSWMPDFDAWAIADHACMAGHRRVIAEPARLDEVEAWTTSEHLWTKRAALVMTLPWTRMRHPKPEDDVARERILGWAASYVPDQRWVIQKTVAWWVRDLSRHAPDRAQSFLDAHGDQMKTFARREAERHLKNRQQTPESQGDR